MVRGNTLVCYIPSSTIFLHIASRILACLPDYFLLMQIQLDEAILGQVILPAVLSVVPDTGSFVDVANDFDGYYYDYVVVALQILGWLIIRIAIVVAIHQFVL